MKLFIFHRFAMYFLEVLTMLQKVGGGSPLVFTRTNQILQKHTHTLTVGNFILNRNIFSCSCCTQQHCTCALFFPTCLNKYEQCRSTLRAAWFLGKSPCFTCPHFSKLCTKWKGPCFGEREGSWYKSCICTLKGDLATCTVKHLG